MEQVEKNYNAQLAYSFDMALQNEFSLEENIELAKEFVQKYFVSDGMIADLAIHKPDKEEGGIPNPHFHVLVPIRPLNADGTWGAKQRREYHLDENDNRIKKEMVGGSSMPFLQQIGASRKRWICGVKPGRIWSMIISKKKVWTAVSTIALM